MTGPNLRTFGLEAFNWGPKKKHLVLKETMVFGKLPLEIYVLGYQYKILFEICHQDYEAEAAIYAMAPQQPDDVDNSIRVIVPWKRRRVKIAKP
jgi:hypothetical protein